MFYNGSLPGGTLFILALQCTGILVYKIYFTVIVEVLLYGIISTALLVARLYNSEHVLQT